ncbi:MAG: D-glycero-beta-D-manno-heptose-7-phosphate kinase [Bdellovibrio sp. CG10_big_fil_rev_8_21_14_0_10_47_8]|nr:MAG: D-glycero-beta-D-manno-heptose-7-phosphate kinase [Bdellovibrio sp. CG10_big_fil_rev_8_21_14_0_10_47_8]
MSKLNSIPIATAGASEKKKLLDQLPRLKGKKILILGDVGLDEYILGEVRRISPEAPVPVLEVESEDLRLGLAANVAQNVKSLGGEPILVSVVGPDSGADLLRALFQRHAVSTEFLIADEQRPTTRKTRVMAKHHHLVRVDREVRKFISAETEKRVLAQVQTLIPDVDAVVIEDYAKGVVSQALLQQVVSLAHAKNKKVFVDPHQTNCGDFYAGVDLVKPNFSESVALSGLDYDELRDDPDKLIELGWAVQKRTGAKEVVMTLGKDGMIIFSGTEIMRVPTFARQVFDVTGAGDTVIAAMTLGLVSGLNLTESCMLANFAAGVVVGQVGCVACSQEDLRQYIQSI